MSVGFTLKHSPLKNGENKQTSKTLNKRLNFKIERLKSFFLVKHTPVILFTTSTNHLYAVCRQLSRFRNRANNRMKPQSLSCAFFFNVLHNYWFGALALLPHEEERLNTLEEPNPAQYPHPTLQSEGNFLHMPRIWAHNLIASQSSSRWAPGGKEVGPNSKGTRWLMKRDGFQGVLNSEICRRPCFSLAGLN